MFGFDIDSKATHHWRHQSVSLYIFVWDQLKKFLHFICLFSGLSLLGIVIGIVFLIVTIIFQYFYFSEDSNVSVFHPVLVLLINVPEPCCWLCVVACGV